MRKILWDLVPRFYQFMIAASATPIGGSTSTKFLPVFIYEPDLKFYQEIFKIFYYRNLIQYSINKLNYLSLLIS